MARSQASAMLALRGQHPQPVDQGGAHSATPSSYRRDSTSVAALRHTTGSRRSVVWVVIRTGRQAARRLCDQWRLATHCASVLRAMCFRITPGQLVGGRRL